MSLSSSLLQSTQRRFCVSTLPPQTKFILRRQSRGQQAYSRDDSSLSVLRDRQQAVAVIRGGRLSYVCIYKTNFSPIMLVSISSCVFNMILKYGTLYSKSEVTLNREKLLTNDANVSTILFVL